MRYGSRIILLALALNGTLGLRAGSRENPIVLENACEYQVKVVFRMQDGGVFDQVVPARNTYSVGLGANFKWGDPKNYIKEMMIDGTERKLPDGTRGHMWFQTKDMLDNEGKKLAGPINRPWHFLIFNRKTDGRDMPYIETFSVAKGKALGLTNQ